MELEPQGGPDLFIATCDIINTYKPLHSVSHIHGSNCGNRPKDVVVTLLSCGIGEAKLECEMLSLDGLMLTEIKGFDRLKLLAEMIDKDI